MIVKLTLWRQAQHDLVLLALEQCGGNRTHAARFLGVSVRTIRNKIREYGLEAWGTGPVVAADIHAPMNEGASEAPKVEAHE